MKKRYKKKVFKTKKEIIELERYKKKKILKKYEKLCHSEGIVSSRVGQRGLTNTSPTITTCPITSQNIDTNNSDINNRTRDRFPPSKPLKQMKKQSIVNQNETKLNEKQRVNNSQQQQNQKQHEIKPSQIIQKQNDRKSHHRMRVTTKNGQPLLSKKITLLLAKLESST